MGSKSIQAHKFQSSKIKNKTFIEQDLRFG